MDFALAIIGADADMVWDVDGFGSTPNIDTCVYTSIKVPLGTFFVKPDFGFPYSKIARAKNTPTMQGLVAQYAQQALQWLIDVGKAASIDVATEVDDKDPARINMKITVYQANQPPVVYNYFVSVGGP